MEASEIDQLKKDVELLKTKQGIPTEIKSDDNLARLSVSIDSLIEIFKEANEELKMDTHDAVLVGEKLDKSIDSLDKMEVQNEKIAKGVVAVADMIEELQVGGTVHKKIPELKHIKEEPSSEATKPLPQLNLPPDEKKKGFLNFKI